MEHKGTIIKKKSKFPEKDTFSCSEMIESFLYIFKVLVWGDSEAEYISIWGMAHTGQVSWDQTWTNVDMDDVIPII